MEGVFLVAWCKLGPVTNVYFLLMRWLIIPVIFPCSLLELQEQGCKAIGGFAALSNQSAALFGGTDGYNLMFSALDGFRDSTSTRFECGLALLTVFQVCATFL